MLSCVTSRIVYTSLDFLDSVIVLFHPSPMLSLFTFFPRISHKLDWILTSLTKELLSFSLAGNINKSFDEWRPLIVNSSFNKKEELCALGPQSSLEYHNSALFYEMFTNQRWLSARFLISSPNRDCNQWDMSSIIDYDIERPSPGIKKEMELVVILD